MELRSSLSATLEACGICVSGVAHRHTWRGVCGWTSDIWAIWGDQKESTKTPEQRTDSPASLHLTQKTGVVIALRPQPGNDHRKNQFKEIRRLAISW